MTRTLYDLAGADPAFRFSPYCWRIKLALAHKGLSFDTVPWRFTDKEQIAFSGQGQVPVLVDGGTVLHDSQSIAEYLEATYAAAPSLFGDAASRALINFVNQWTEEVLRPAIVKIVLPDIFFHRIAAKDQAYFRASREARFGTTIEAMAEARDSFIQPFQITLTPLRSTLRSQAFLGGATPNHADHIVFGALQWARLTSTTTLLAADDPISVWMERLLSHLGMQGPPPGA